MSVPSVRLDKRLATPPTPSGHPGRERILTPPARQDQPTAQPVAARRRRAAGSLARPWPSHPGRLAGVLVSPSPSRLELFRSNAIEPPHMKPCVALATPLLRTGSSCELGVSRNLPATVPTFRVREPHMPRTPLIRPGCDQLRYELQRYLPEGAGAEAEASTLLDCS